MSFPVVATSSFQISKNDRCQDGEKKSGNGEVSGLTIHQNIYSNSDKKLKRLISNRVAAQKSRCKKLQYVDDLENKHTELTMQVSVLRSQVAMASVENRCVKDEHSELEECLTAMHQHAIASQREFETTRVEIKRLKLPLSLIRKFLPFLLRFG